MLPSPDDAPLDNDTSPDTLPDAELMTTDPDGAVVGLESDSNDDDDAPLVIVTEPPVAPLPEVPPDNTSSLPKPDPLLPTRIRTAPALLAAEDPLPILTSPEWLDRVIPLITSTFPLAPPSNIRPDCTVTNPDWDPSFDPPTPLTTMTSPPVLPSMCDEPP
jgi:hypothetical protein